MVITRLYRCACAFFSFEAGQRALRFGVTTARTMQCDHSIDIDIRDAHQNGQADLPDVIAAGYQTRPDMFAAFVQDFPALNDLKPKLSGEEDVRRVVKALVSPKVDHIKLLQLNVPVHRILTRENELLRMKKW